MCNRRRQQRAIIAEALLTSLHEYQSNKSRARSSSITQRANIAPFQEPVIQGVTQMAPRYVEPVDPNPPAYEEAITDPQSPTIIDEKRQLYRLSTDEQVPPHVSQNYNPNTGLDAQVLRSTPAPPVITFSSPTNSTLSSKTPTINRSNTLSHLLDATALYFDTQIKLHADQPAAVRRLEHKKAKKLEKAEKRFNEHMAKGKDSKHNHKMEKRAEKLEKWTEWVLQKSVDHHEKHARRHESCCGSHARQPRQQYSL